VFNVSQVEQAVLSKETRANRAIDLDELNALLGNDDPMTKARAGVL